MPKWHDDLQSLVDYLRPLINRAKGPNYNSAAVYGLLNSEMYGSPPCEPDASLEEIFKLQIESAVEAAQRGNWRPLSELIDPNHPFNSRYPVQIWKSLSVEARELMRDIISGHRKRPNHRPPLTEAERRKASPVHTAAGDIPLTRALLHQLYPDQPNDDIFDRAVAVIGKIHRVKAEILRGYLKRSKNDRRRL